VIDKTFIQNVIVIVGSLVLAFILAEFVLRMTLPAPIIWKYPQEEYQFDSKIGHWLKHNQLAFTHDKSVRTNSIGIRDSDYLLEHSPDVFRVLALGDSQTFGNGLELVDTWPKQLEEILRKSCEKRIEVINGGIPGTDTWQHEIINQRLQEAYSPDLLILAFYVNDVVNSFIPMPPHEDPNNNIAVRTVYLLKRSVLLLSLRSAISNIRQLFNPSQEFLQQQSLLMGKTDPAIMERWAQVDKSLAAMKNTSNADLIIFALPRRDQVRGQMPWEGYYGQIKYIADRNGIKIISMLEPLMKLYGQYGDELFIPWDGHNTKIANHVIAEEAAAAVLAIREKASAGSACLEQ
jgi:lysophospholipase L1-like esterase